jgi:hypothetical protein
LNGWLAAWRIDPSPDRLCRRLGFLSDEAFGVFAESAVERDLAGGVDHATRRCMRKSRANKKTGRSGFPVELMTSRNQVK